MEPVAINTMLKRQIMEQVKQFDIEKVQNHANMNDTVTLYHGTSTVHLNSILENGILPRDLTGNNNWEHEEALSNEGIVYLTNKFHYWYAYNTVEKQLRDKYGEDWSSNPQAQWWLNCKVLPVYITVNVPKAFLTLDEDIAYTKFVKDKLKQAVKNQADFSLNVTWEDSLAHQGTVGVMGGIPKEWITSFTILADPHFYLALKGEKAVYEKEVKKWFEGKGKGKMKLADLKALEQKYPKTVVTIPIKAIPKGLKISQFYYNQPDKGEKELAFIMNAPAEYLQQPNKLEII